MEKKQIQIQPRAIPVFADEAQVVAFMKGNKDKKARFKKDGFVRLTFMDIHRRQTVADVVISPITAEAVMGIMANQLAELDKALKSKKMPKSKKVPVSRTTEEQRYIG